MMNARISPLRSARWGLATVLSLPIGLILTGCGGKDATESAKVTISEPSATTSAAPAPGASGAAPAAATPTPGATAKPADVTAATPAAGGAEGWGTLKGKVIFSGEIPKAKVLVAKGDKSVKDGEFCAKQAIDSQRLIVDPASKGVQYAIVYIPKPTKVNPEAVSAAKTAEVVFDQKNCTFSPHVLAAMKGATVTIKSSDPVGHNANAVGLNNNKFNLPTQPLSSQPYLLKGVDKPGKIGCDIHPWMEAYWLVLDNPYFAVTDAQGNFEIKNVPAGDQKVVVWSEAVGPGYVTTPSGDPVNIKAGGETAKDYTLDAARVK